MTSIVLSLQDEPSRGLGDEEEGDGQYSRNDVDDAEGNQVCGSIWSCRSCPVNDGADKRALYLKSVIRSYQQDG